MIDFPTISDVIEMNGGIRLEKIVYDVLIGEDGQS